MRAPSARTLNVRDVNVLCMERAVFVNDFQPGQWHVSPPEHSIVIAECSLVTVKINHHRCQCHPMIAFKGIGLAVLKALAGAGANVGMHGLGDPKVIAKIRDEIAAESGAQLPKFIAGFREMQEKMTDGMKIDK
eukprot:1162083-Pelagomonas_calceolata.AAC.1